MFINHNIIRAPTAHGKRETDRGGGGGGAISMLEFGKLPKTEGI